MRSRGSSVDVDLPPHSYLVCEVFRRCLLHRAMARFRSPLPVRWRLQVAQTLLQFLIYLLIEKIEAIWNVLLGELLLNLVQNAVLVLGISGFAILDHNADLALLHVCRTVVLDGLLVEESLTHFCNNPCALKGDQVAVKRHHETMCHQPHDSGELVYLTSGITRFELCHATLAWIELRFLTFSARVACVIISFALVAYAADASMLIHCKDAKPISLPQHFRGQRLQKVLAYAYLGRAASILQDTEDHFLEIIAPPMTHQLSGQAWAAFHNFHVAALTLPLSLRNHNMLYNLPCFHAVAFWVRLPDPDQLAY
mmetsp:Transcript_68968/g.114260  ORF Transcript_68968/g.114260 Transcript_68968/m.114260 type:complete len:311 (-) Transcript_68968:191-1123(-)